MLKHRIPVTHRPEHPHLLLAGQLRPLQRISVRVERIAGDLAYFDSDFNVSYIAHIFHILHLL